MALAVGTNCGFISGTTRPSGDPGGEYSNKTMDSSAHGFKVTSPAGDNAVTEVGWYCYNATEEANFQVGIYSHNGATSFPNVLIKTAVEKAKGTDAGWKYAAYSVAIDASTTYWIGVQLDDTATGTTTEYTTGADDAYWFADDYSETALPDPWDTQDNFGKTVIVAYYALYSAAGGGAKLLLLQNTLGGDANRMTA